MGRSRTRIGIFGPLHFPQAETVAHALRARGAEVLAVDSRSPLPIIWRPEAVTVSGHPLDEIDGAYVLGIPPRQPVLGERLRAEPPRDDVSAGEWIEGLARGHAARDVVVSVLDGLVALGRPVLNAPVGGTYIQQKLQDLSDAYALGLLVPDTVVTSDEASRSAFLARVKDQGGEVVTKPVRGGAHARRVDDVPAGAHPILLQLRIVGEDVRVMFLDDDMLLAAASPASTTVDHRADPAYQRGEQDVRSIAIDDATRVRLRALMTKRGLRFVGVDLKRDADGHLYFLEMNQAPIFDELAQHLSVDVAGALADALCRDSSRAR